MKSLLCCQERPAASSSEMSLLIPLCAHFRAYSLLIRSVPFAYWSASSEINPCRSQNRKRLLNLRISAGVGGMPSRARRSGDRSWYFFLSGGIVSLHLQVRQDALLPSL